jgi:preprotein translocase subunit SecY
MRKVIETLKNIWKIEDLRQRLLITLLFVTIYRLGFFRGSARNQSYHVDGVA